jgi:hypothetical protein
MLFRCEHASKSCYTGARSMLDDRGTSMARGVANNASLGSGSSRVSICKDVCCHQPGSRGRTPAHAIDKTPDGCRSNQNVPLPNLGDDERSKMSKSCHPRPLSTLPRPKPQRTPSNRHLLTPFAKHNRSRERSCDATLATYSYETATSTCTHHDLFITGRLHYLHISECPGLFRGSCHRFCTHT